MMNEEFFEPTRNPNSSQYWNNIASEKPIKYLLFKQLIVDIRQLEFSCAIIGTSEPITGSSIFQ